MKRRQTRLELINLTTLLGLKTGKVLKMLKVFLRISIIGQTFLKYRSTKKFPKEALRAQKDLSLVENIKRREKVAKLFFEPKNFYRIKSHIADKPQKGVL